MRKLIIPDVSFNALDGDGTVTVLSAAQQLYRLVMFAQSPERGFTVDDVRRRLPLGEKLDKAKKTLLLEDAEHALLQEAFKEASWRGASQNVIALADAIENAETVNVDAEDHPRPNRAARRRQAQKG